MRRIAAATERKGRKGVDFLKEVVVKSAPELARLQKEVDGGKSQPVRVLVRADISPEGARILFPIEYTNDRNSGLIGSLYNYYIAALGIGPRPRSYNCGGFTEVRKKGNVYVKSDQKLFAIPDEFEEAGVSVELVLTYSNSSLPVEVKKSYSQRSANASKGVEKGVRTVTRKQRPNTTCARLLEYAQQHGSVTNRELREAFPNIPRGTISGYLSKLVHGGCLTSPEAYGEPYKFVCGTDAATKTSRRKQERTELQGSASRTSQPADVYGPEKGTQAYIYVPRRGTQTAKVLETLFTHSGISPKRISELTGINVNNVSAHLSFLKDRNRSRRDANSGLHYYVPVSETGKESQRSGMNTTHAIRGDLKHESAPSYEGGLDNATTLTAIAESPADSAPVSIAKPSTKKAKPQKAVWGGEFAGLYRPTPGSLADKLLGVLSEDRGLSAEAAADLAEANLGSVRSQMTLLRNEFLVEARDRNYYKVSLGTALERKRSNYKVPDMRRRRPAEIDDESTNAGGSENKTAEVERLDAGNVPLPDTAQGRQAAIIAQTPDIPRSSYDIMQDSISYARSKESVTGQELRVRGLTDEMACMLVDTGHLRALKGGMYKVTEQGVKDWSEGFPELQRHLKGFDKNLTNIKVDVSAFVAHDAPANLRQGYGRGSGTADKASHAAPSHHNANVARDYGPGSVRILRYLGSQQAGTEIHTGDLLKYGDTSDIRELERKGCLKRLSDRKYEVTSKCYKVSSAALTNPVLK